VSSLTPFALVKDGAWHETLDFDPKVAFSAFSVDSKLSRKFDSATFSPRLLSLYLSPFNPICPTLFQLFRLLIRILVLVLVLSPSSLSLSLSHSRLGISHSCQQTLTQSAWQQLASESSYCRGTAIGQPKPISPDIRIGLTLRVRLPEVVQKVKFSPIISFNHIIHHHIDTSRAFQSLAIASFVSFYL
jgi:hypothetical protein